MQWINNRQLHLTLLVGIVKAVYGNSDLAALNSIGSCVVIR